jgi:hypothetical protein
MSTSKTIDIDSRNAGPPYTGWRGQLLAELALARLPGLVVSKAPRTSDQGYDFLVATRKGACFFIEVKAFSSTRLKGEKSTATAEWRWSIDADLIRRARESRSPFFLFLIDADTDLGRFFRLDSLPAPDAKARMVIALIPPENSIDKEGLTKLVSELETERK